MPPDLSLKACRGTDWIYTYLKSFYSTKRGPLGWNNKLFPERVDAERAVGDAGPAAAGSRQGRKAATARSTGSWCWRRRARRRPRSSTRACATSPPSSSTPASRRRSAQQSLGVWVVLFLAFFTFLAWLP